MIVDPGDAAPVQQVLQEKELELVAILVTHRHWDHVDGIKDLLAYYDVPVYGPDSPRIPQISHKVYEGDTLTFFDQALSLKVLEVPGHTQEHIAYTGEVEGQPMILCGDTLFAAGCGRVSGGTHEQLCHSLDRINQLPANTQIYCTHEYTLANLQFAEAVEPENPAIKERTKNEQKKREQGLPTLPTTLSLERETNPFLRYREPQLTRAINQFWKANWSTDVDLFSGLRHWKDSF